MVSSYNKMWLSCLVASALVVMATAQANEYLPPNKGYNYDKPAVPFPSNNNGNQQPAPGPYPARQPTPTSYQPPQQPQRPYLPPQEHEHHDQEHHDHHHHEPGMPFDFSYAVNENGNDYSHNSVSDGDVTTGEYRVALPDGRTQIVKYTADWKNGFNAEVSYEGEAKFPEQQRYAPAPATGGQGYSEGGGYQY